MSMNSISISIIVGIVIYNSPLKNYKIIKLFLGLKCSGLITDGTMGTVVHDLGIVNSTNPLLITATVNLTVINICFPLIN